ARPRMMNSARARNLRSCLGNTHDEARGLYPRGYRLLIVAIRVGQQGQVTGTLDGRGQLALVTGLGTGNAAGHNLAGFGDVGLEGFQVLVIDLLYAFGGKAAKL